MCLYRYELFNTMESYSNMQKKKAQFEKKLSNVYKFKQLVQDYFMWLSKYLSQHKVVNPKDVYNKLDALAL